MTEEILTCALSEFETLYKELSANSLETAYKLEITNITATSVSTLGTVLKTRTDVFVDLSPTTLPASITELRETFKNCSTLVFAPKLPDSVTNMSRCFYGCTSLTSVPNIPDSVTEMGYCFYNCKQITSVPRIPDTVISMVYCFRGCSSLVEITNIPTGVGSLSGYFYGCKSLTSVPNIPESVTSMYNCFYGCTSLTSVPNIPDSVTNMDYCFLVCTSLISVPNIPESVTSMKSCFNGCTALESVPNIPESVTDMNSCFRGCSSLESVPNISESVTDMNCCFYGCTSLTSIPTIPNSVTDMNSCFRGCSSLVTVPNMPSSVKYLTKCFDGCTNLVTVDNWQLESFDKVEYENAFRGCTALENIYVQHTPTEPLDSYALFHIEKTNDVNTVSIIKNGEIVTNTFKGEFSNLSVKGVIDEFAIGEQGTIPFDIAKKVNEFKVPLSSDDKDFSPNDPHMVIWAKDKSKVKANIIENALAGEDSTTELNDADSLIVVQDGETKKVEFESVVNKLTSQFGFLKKTDFYLHDNKTETYKMKNGVVYLFINVHILNMGDVVLLSYWSGLDRKAAQVIATAPTPVNIQYTAGNDGVFTFYSYGACRGYLYEIDPSLVSSL